MNKCLACKRNGTNDCPIYKTHAFNIDNCSMFENSTMNGVVRQIEPMIREHIGTACIICGEFVELPPDESPMDHTAKVCDKCKEAVLKVRSELEKLDKVFNGDESERGNAFSGFNVLD